MLGVIVAYPGTAIAPYMGVNPGIHFSDDGFGIGMMPTLATEKRIITYSNKTIVLVESPEVLLWRIWRRYYSERPATAFLTSMVDGAQRLNFFYGIWLKVCAEKGIQMVNAINTRRFTRVFDATFGTAPGPIDQIPITIPAWDDNAKNIITGFCQNWKAVNERS